MWKFDGKHLTSPTGKTWPARSGGIVGTKSNVSYGSDGRARSLPEGPYRILRNRASGVAQEEMRVPGRKDGWFVPVEPLFQTERGTPGRGRFGIHPDGGLPGTEGCIGIFSGDYDELYRLLTDRSVSEQLEVY